MALMGPMQSWKISSERVMKWAEILQDKSLQDLPYKIETNQFGQIVMSPASNRHCIFQGRIIRILGAMTTDGDVMPECSVQTLSGVKVNDVAWGSSEFLDGQGDKIAYDSAPELCVEVLSPSNLEAEIEEKTALYFQHGAREVWICDNDGCLRFLDAKGEIPKSVLFPKFPANVGSRLT